MECPKCDNLIQDGVQLCNQCGAKFAPKRPPVVGVVRAAPMPPPVPQTASNGRGLFWTVMALILIWGTISHQLEQQRMDAETQRAAAQQRANQKADEDYQQAKLAYDNPSAASLTQSLATARMDTPPAPPPGYYDRHTEATPDGYSGGYSGGGMTYVHSYTRRNGTHVSGYYRHRR